MRTFSLLICLILFQSMALADVWVDTESWNEQWESKYSEWVKSPAVNKDIFVAASSPYRGIIADCADVAYAFRAIFSYENGLNFSAKNPVANSRSAIQVFSNRMTRFDHISDPDRRVVAFANYLGQSLGTETLAANDSYPLKIDQIRASDLYLYKMRKSNAFIRHNYNIKDIDKRGNFEVIYATQAIRAARGPMIQRVKGLYHAPITYKWGFRRYDSGESHAPTALGDEQFTLAAQLGERGFFAHVKARLSQEVEDPESMMKGQLQGYCDQVKERIDIVNSAIAHQRVLGGSCMDYRDFDTHSTPSRDGRLNDLVTNLQLDYQELTEAQKRQLSLKTLDLMDGLFSRNPSFASLDALSEYCSISYKTGVVVNLRDIRLRISQGLLSSHPNDSLESRWGERTNGKTRCKAFY
jgi:hypothetical protein